MVKPENQVPMSGSEAPPDYLSELDERDAGLGLSNQFADQALPLAVVLQAGSPECDARGSGYLSGAEAGKFLLRNAINPVRNDLDVIYIDMVHGYVEWVKDRGGFVARYFELPNDVIISRNKNRPVFTRPNGNLVEKSRDLYLSIDGSLYLFPCTSTKHQFARDWQSYLHQIRNPKTGLVMPAFAKKYRLTTIRKSNQLGSWFNPVFADIGWLSRPEYEQAKILYLSLREQRAALPDSGRPQLPPAA
jgi:hypothetical protein